MSSATDLNLLDLGLTEVPEDIAQRSGNVVTTLNMTENALRAPGNLGHFKRLHTLILDKNGLPGLAGLPRMDSVTTLWFNNNEVGDLVEFLDEVVATYPNVTYLSLMRNPASPPLVCLSEEDVQATQRYRLYVIFRLPRLQFLDSGPVLAEERKEAAARGQFLAVRKPKAKSQSTMGKPVTPSAVGGVFGAFAASAAASSGGSGAGATAGSGGGGQSTPGSDAGGGVDGAGSPSGRRPQAFLGLGSSSYDGRHSEGNRFIVDKHL